MNKYFEALELHKILEMLANEASNFKTKELALALEPDTNMLSVKKEIEKTTEALDLASKFGTPIFYNFKDITSSIKRADSGSNLTLREILDIGQMLNQIRQLSIWYKQCQASETDIGYLFSSLMPNKFLEDKISNAIINEEEIADCASSELASIRRKIIQSGMKIRENLDKMVKSTTTQKYLQESIVTIRDGRYVLPVKAEYKHEVAGLLHDTSSSGATLFIEPMAIVEANNEIRLLKGKEQDEIERIISELSADCAEIGERLIINFDACVELNLYFSKANLGAKMHAMTPEICDNGEVIIKKARHPLIDTNKVIPVDISLGIHFNALIITGPNTGGKTVILKTIGLLTAMTMCGLLIPASDGSKISIFKNILVDIGDQQSIEQSLSTFSSHINKVIDILKIADYSSLVLLDELGSGTDPVEGSALAISIIEKLKSNGAKLVTTTHYQDLKLYAIDTKGVENASCEFDVKTLKPTYRLILGSPGKSNAFAISSKLGIPDDIIEYAQGLIGTENTRFETILSQLEASRIELDEQNKLIKSYKIEAEQQKNLLEKERSDFNKQKDKELENSRIQAMRIVESVRLQSQQLIDELDDLRKQKETENFTQLAIDARLKNKGKLDKMYIEANPIIEKSDGYVLPRPLKKGDSVLIVDINKNGIVVSPADSSGNCFVQAGIMKTKINVKKLRLVEAEKVTYNSKQISTKGIESRMTREIKLELDIRGYASDEGVQELDTFLDNAVMSGINLVTIIHGKGTGVLKNAVRQHLRNHPLVKTSRKGVYGEGEDGVTIVELK